MWRISNDHQSPLLHIQSLATNTSQDAHYNHCGIIRDGSQSLARSPLLAGVRITNLCDDLDRFFWIQRQVAKHLECQRVSVNVLLTL